MKQMKQIPKASASIAKGSFKSAGAVSKAVVKTTYGIRKVLPKRK
jgi:hypothetical protein